MMSDDNREEGEILDEEEDSDYSLTSGSPGKGVIYEDLRNSQSEEEIGAIMSSSGEDIEASMASMAAAVSIVVAPPPGAPRKTDLVGPSKVPVPVPVERILEEVVVWPDLAAGQDGHPLKEYPPPLQSLWRNSMAYRATLDKDPDPEVSQIFTVSHGIDDESGCLYPEGAPYTEDMKLQLQSCCNKLGYNPHYVEWIIQCGAGGQKLGLPQLVVKFKWLESPKMVVVQSKIVLSKPSSEYSFLADFLLRSEFVLKCLWNGDSGSQCPTEYSKDNVKQYFGTPTFQELSKTFGYPFKWAQKFIELTDPKDVLNLPFKLFMKLALSEFHHLVKTWDDTRASEARIMRKFNPFYGFNGWRYVDARAFRRYFRGVSEHRLDNCTTTFPGRLMWASLEQAEFTIHIGAILYKRFPSVLPCFLVKFQRKSRSEENISKDTLELMIGDINADILAKEKVKPGSIIPTPQLSLHVLQMTNLIYHVDDLMMRKPLPHFPPKNAKDDVEVDTLPKTRTPVPSSMSILKRRHSFCSSSKKRQRDDKADSAMKRRHRFSSKISRKYSNHSHSAIATTTSTTSATATTTIIRQNNVAASTTNSSSFPVSIQLDKLPTDCRRVVVSVSPTRDEPEEDPIEQEIDFSERLHIPDDPFSGNLFNDNFSEEDDDRVFHTQEARSTSPSLLSDDFMRFEYETTAFSHNSDDSGLLTPPENDHPGTSEIENGIDEFPNNMEVAEQVVVSFEGEPIDAAAALVGVAGEDIIFTKSEK